MRTLPLCLLAVLGAAACCQAEDLPPASKLPVHKDLPDVLKRFDGTPVRTAEDWVKKRRPELQRLLQHYMYGHLPRAVKLDAKVEHEDRKALGGKAILREVSLGLADTKAPRLYVLLVIPTARKGPAPVFVGLNFTGNHTLVDDPGVHITQAWIDGRRPGVKDNRATAEGRGKARDNWAIEQTIDRGYAVATAYYGEVDPDRKEVRGGLRPFIDRDEKAGTIAFWAWGIHRIIDHLSTLPELDARKIIAVGHSRLGKTALVAAAFDERIALAIPHQAGCGGTAPSRDTIGGLPAGKVETVKRINTSFPHWFNATFKTFNEQPERLPFDQHALTALVAPRPVLFTNATEDLWANPPGQFAILRAAEPVWRLLGAGGLESTEMPRTGVLSAGKLGYWVRAGKHSMTPADWKIYLDFADKHLGKPGATTSATRKLLLIGQGPDGHKPGTHEYVSGLAILSALLKNTPGLELMHARADGAWKEGPELIDRVDGVVLFLAEGAKWLAGDRARREALFRLHRRGGGITALHWAIGTRDAAPIKEFVALVGGCHGGPDRKYKVLETDVTVAARTHPITRGLKDFQIHDEFYYQLKLAPTAVEPILRARVDGSDHTVAWAYHPRGGGRSFGFSGLHFHANWKNAAYRRLVTQGVLWSLGLPVPEGGVDVGIDARLLESKK